MNEVVVFRGGALRSPSFNVGVDPFRQAFEPAAPVLDAVAQLRPVWGWYAPHRNVPFDLEDEYLANEALATIPDEKRLEEVRELFRGAECDPAPESWCHICIGLLLAALPDGTVNADMYRHAVMDALYRDQAVSQQYEAGFSAPVIVMSVRAARLMKKLPHPGEFVGLCRENRKKFQRWAASIDGLISFRYQARVCLGQLTPDDPDYIEWD